MTRRCPRCGRVYEGALKRYCSRCHVELVEPPPEPEPSREPAPPPRPRELSFRARFEGALFALVLLVAVALNLVFFATDASVPWLLLVGADALVIGLGGALYLRERRQ